MADVDVIGDVLVAIGEALTKAEFKRLVIGEVDDSLNLSEFIALKFNGAELLHQQGSNFFIPITFTHYLSTTGAPKEPNIRAIYSQLSRNNSKNLYRLFQFGDTRVDLPHSSEIWFTADRFGSAKLGNTGYVTRIYEGYISIVE